MPTVIKKTTIGQRIIPITCNSINDAFLKAYWKLDEANGNAIDSKGSNTGVDNNVVTSTAGKIINARVFDASVFQRFEVDDNTDLSTGDIDFTLGAWVYYSTTLSAGAFPGILSKWDGQSGQSEYLLYLNGDAQRYKFVVSSTGSDASEIVANNAGDPSDNAWHFIIAWHDSIANTLNIQVDNGTVDSTSYSAGVFDSSTAFRIGSLTGVNGWTGNIDEVFFTKRILTADERSALYNNGLGCRPAGL
jgi:hypothetical protein